MLSRIKGLLTGVGFMRISTKITCLYAIICVGILFFTSTLIGLGLYYSLYHQAEFELKVSMWSTVKYLDNLDKGRSTTPPYTDAEISPEAREGLAHYGINPDEMVRGPVPDHEGKVRRKRSMVLSSDAQRLMNIPLMPGVVLRIIDENDDIVFENDMHYPSIEEVQSHLRTSTPFWLTTAMQVADFHNMSLYYAKLNTVVNGHAYDLYFFRTITAERHFLDTMQRMVFLTVMLGLILALLAGYLISNRILQPIRVMTRTARQIEVERMDKRVEARRKVKDELTELAGTLNHMLDRLQSGFEQQQRFVSDASHELRTPVTVIKGYADMLARWGKDDPETLNEGISAIQSEAENMQQLIEKLLFLARADQKRQVLRKEIIQVDELLGDVMKKLKQVESKHQVELLQNDPALILGDVVTIKQMMRIFLDNALKYTPEGGRITASSVRHEDYLEMSFADTGIGISPEHQQKVFERFYRVDTSRTKVAGTGGTGLGMSIAWWIAHQHDIDIKLESEIGKGTTIRLIIPLLKEE